MFGRHDARRSECLALFGRATDRLVMTSTLGATKCALDARDGGNWINWGVDRFPVLMPDRLPVPHKVCRSARKKYAMKADCVAKTMVWVLLAVLLRCFFRRRRRHDFHVLAIGPRPIFLTDTVEIVDFRMARITRRWSKLPARRIWRPSPRTARSKPRYSKSRIPGDIACG